MGAPVAGDTLAGGWRSGPRCTTDDTDQDIMLYSGSNSHHKALPRDIARELPVSARTVRRRLCEIDLHTFVRRREHAFTVEDLRRRMSFAEGYSLWGDAEWSGVLWSDHTLFTLDYETRERLQGAVWLWGCFCAE
jgi:hypothetical protein